MSVRQVKDKYIYRNHASITAAIKGHSIPRKFQMKKKTEIIVCE